LCFLKNGFGSLVRSSLVWFGYLVFHVFPTRARQMAERLLLTRQHRGRCRQYSGKNSAPNLKLTVNMWVHLEGDTTVGNLDRTFPAFGKEYC
jgi:hypothetical protein